MKKTSMILLATAVCLSFLIPANALAEQPDVLAQVGDVKITRDEVLAAAASQLAEIRQQEYDAIKGALDGIVDQTLLAKQAEKEGITLEEYFDKYIEKVIKEPTDQEVNDFYEKFKSRLRGQTLEAARPQIVARLRQVEGQKIYSQIMTGLKSATKVSVFLDPPRVAVTAGDNPTWGPKDAPVTIIEFSDYQCPYCGRAEKEAVAQVKENYKGKVRIVFRDFPLAFHKDSEKAHEAAACAGEQDKFWEMHDKLFANARALGIDKLYGYATEIGLDGEKFKACLDSGKTAAAIQQDLADGASFGVTGTPAFFINGRFISGAQPYSVFSEIIDDELARAGK